MGQYGPDKENNVLTMTYNVAHVVPNTKSLLKIAINAKIIAGV